MLQNKFGEMVFAEDDLFNLLMQGHRLTSNNPILVDSSVDISSAHEILTSPFNVSLYNTVNENLSLNEYDLMCQTNWHMPEQYQELDIAEHVLSLCKSEDELQRVGQELLIYQERDMFPLLRYLKYLVDTMKSNNIIWGVGRGSSVASYVLYKLEIHKVNSLYYDLDIRDFLR
jgi:DNA polymerase III alpha subunit